MTALARAAAVAFLTCPACGCEGIAATGTFCSTCGGDGCHAEIDCAGTLGPGWWDDERGPCVSCGVALRVCVDDERAFAVEVER